MRENISDPRKPAAQVDDIWQSSSTRSVNAVSADSLPILCRFFADSPPLPDQDEFVQAIRQHPQPCPAPCAAPCPAPHALHPPPQPLTSAGIITNKEIKLNIAVLHVPGFRETS